MKYKDRGIRVNPDSLVFSMIFRISRLCRSALRLRLAMWLFQVPCRYSGMWTFCSHTSPSWTDAYPSTSEARPARSDFTSVPVSTMPASHVSSMW